MSDRMVRIVFSNLTTSRLASPIHDRVPTTSSISCLSSSIKVGKLKGAWPKVRLIKASSNSVFSRTTRVEGLVTVASTDKVESWGRGNATIRAFTIKTRTLGSIGLETLILLKLITVPTITSWRGQIYLTLRWGVWLPPTSFSIGVLTLTIVSLGTELLGIESSSTMMGWFSITFSALP